MIDTIVLVVNKEKFHITDPDAFEPSARWIFNERLFGSRSYATAKQNPKNSEKMLGPWKPNLTLTSRKNNTNHLETTLKIQISLPKLLFRNNFDELTDNDFNTVVITLQKRLYEMDVMIKRFDLENALASTVHYSKNIPLIDGTTPYQYIKKFSECNYKLTVDTDQVNYRNHGQVFKLHTNSWEHVVYDKLRELEKAKISDKRSEENDSAIQLNLFEDKKMRRPFEVLRLEARYCKRPKIKQVLKDVGIEFEPTFKNLFSSKVSQLIMLQFLKEFELARPVLLDYKPEHERELLPDLIINNPEYPTRKIIMLYGLKLALDKYDMRELRKLFSKYNNRSWYRLINECQNVKVPIKQDAFKLIREQLQKFKPLRLVDYTV